MKDSENTHYHRWLGTMIEIRFFDSLKGFKLLLLAFLEMSVA